jgi:hypothetical protein
MLKIKGLHMVTTIGWAIILFLALLTRGLISNGLFWLIFSMISVLFVLDVIYFVVRVSEAHYLLITNREVYLKRFFKPIESILISNLRLVEYTKVQYGFDRILLSDGKNKIEIKHDYKFPKKNILMIIQNSSNFPKNMNIKEINKS